jgi:hypothetical protein
MRILIFLLMLAASQAALAHHVPGEGTEGLNEGHNNGTAHPPQSRRQDNATPAGLSPIAIGARIEPAPMHTYCFKNALGKVHCTVLPGGSH